MNITTIHNNLAKKFKDNPQDRKDAKNLEEFLNYIVYNRVIKNNYGENPLEKWMNEETRSILQESSYIKKLKINYEEGKIGARQLGQYGEEGFSYLIANAISLLEKDKILEDSEIEKIIQQVIIGDVQATMISQPIFEKIVKNTEEQIKDAEKKAYANLFRKYGVFALKQGKIDINFAKLELIVKSNSFAERLSQMTASVKNYNKYTIHLEEVSLLKAMQGYYYATNKRSANLKTNEFINNKYLTFIANKVEEDLPHIKHIVELYALTGMGQVYIDKIKKTAIESKLGAKFLIANIRRNKKIFVIPSSSLGQLALSEVKDTSSNYFRFGNEGKLKDLELIEKQKGKMQAIHHYVDVSLNVYQAGKAIDKNSWN